MYLGKGTVGTRTFEFESEVIGQVSTFVVTSKEEESVGVPNLECPQVQHALSS